MKKILAIYGSTGGNTELVVEQVQKILEEGSHSVETKRVEKASKDDIKDHDLYILASPTYGHGVLQFEFQPFADTLTEKEMSGKKFAVIGLGDQRYEKEYLLESAKTLETLVKENGGELIVPPLRILNNPVQHLDTLIKTWAEQLIKILSTKF